MRQRVCVRARVCAHGLRRQEVRLLQPQLRLGGGLLPRPRGLRRERDLLRRARPPRQRLADAQSHERLGLGELQLRDGKAAQRRQRRAVAHELEELAIGRLGRVSPQS